MEYFLWRSIVCNKRRTSPFNIRSPACDLKKEMSDGQDTRKIHKEEISGGNCEVFPINQFSPHLRRPPPFALFEWKRDLIKTFLQNNFLLTSFFFLEFGISSLHSICADANKIINFCQPISRSREELYANNLHIDDASSNCYIHESNQSHGRRTKVRKRGRETLVLRIKKSFPQLGSPEVKFVIKASIRLRSDLDSPQIR